MGEGRRGGGIGDATEDRDDPLVVGEREGLALLAHLVASAELTMTEPWDYGTFRLIDAASRLAAAMAPRSSDEHRAFLEGFLADVDAGKERSTLDREPYLAFLREMSRRIAEHLASRPADGVPAAAPATAPAIETAAPPPAPAPATASPQEADIPETPLRASADTVLETIRSRRVTREFTSQPVSDEALGLVLEAGRWATSGGGRRVHPLLVVRDPATVARLRAVTPGMFSAPPVVIVVCTDANRAAEALIQLDHDTTTMIDVGTLAMNMMVAAHALGLGTCPVTSFSHAAVRVVLDLPTAVEPELFVLLGHPARPGRRERPAGATRRGVAALPVGFAWWEHFGRTETGGG